MKNFHPLALGCIALVLGACGGSGGGMPDSGRVDSGLVDSGLLDSGLVDSGLLDSGLVDSGLVDSGLVDSGADAGSCDDGNPCTVDAAGASGCTHLPAAATTVCRAAASACDVEETCDGTTTACPVDVLADATVVCRAATDVCDVEETCDGTTTACPADVLADATVVCRVSAGTCDVQETCDGTTGACPADVVVAAATECRASTSTCDAAESCDGTSVDCPPDAAGGSLLFGATGASTPSNLYVLDPTTGATVRTVGPIGFPVTGLAFHPTTGVLYGVSTTLSPTFPHSLLTIDPTSGAGTVIGDLAQTIADITFASDGRLFGWSESSDDLAIIDITTGAATIVSDSGEGTYGSGIAFDSSGTLFYTGQGEMGALQTVDPVTGLIASTIGTLTGSSSNGINALAFDSSGVLFGVSNPSGGGAPPTLVRIDTTTAALVPIGPSVTRLDAIAFGGCP